MKYLRWGLSVSAVDLTAHVFTADPSTTGEIDLHNVDVEIVIYGGFDALTEELVENARKAADILSKEYGVYALVVPNTVYWIQTHDILVSHYDFPVLVINGKEVIRGDVIEAEKIVEIALKLIGIHVPENEPMVPIARERDDAVPVIVTW